MVATLNKTSLTFLVEVYTKHPDTGQPGWDIKMVRVKNCRDMEHALAKVKGLPHFDEVITIGETDGGCNLRFCLPSHTLVIR